MKPESTLHCEHVRVRVIDIDIPAEISVPENAHGLILFGDGMSEGIHSPVQQHITQLFNHGGFATVLADLLSREERTQDPRSGESCSGLDLLERRVVTFTDWIAMQPGLRNFPLGYFGVGMGAEAVLIAATRRPEMVRAVVACTPDLDRIEGCLHEIFAPTLIIGADDDSVAVDRQRYRLLQLPERTVREQMIVARLRAPLREKAIADELASAAEEWFGRYLAG